MGRFWFGTMMNNVGDLGDDLPITADTGLLYRVDADGTATIMERNIGVSNGPCWSPDNRIFYFTDSRNQVIWAYDFDLAAGTISNRRVLNDSRDHGYPDGATVDAEGFLWSARWEGACVLRIDPKGRIDRVVPMPARRVTNVCFGGAKLDTLYVTSSRGCTCRRRSCAGIPCRAGSSASTPVLPVSKNMLSPAEANPLIVIQ